MDKKDVLNELKNISDPRVDYSKILTSLHYTHFALLDKYKRILEPYGLTFSQSHVLGIVKHFYPKELSLEEIKKMVLEPNSDVSRTVARLVTKGYLKKSRNPDNRRKRAIVVTESGMRLVEELRKETRFANILNGISLEQAKNLMQVLETLRAANTNK